MAITISISRSRSISRTKTKNIKKNIKKSKSKNTKQNAKQNAKKNKINKKNRKTKKTMKGGHVDTFKPQKEIKEQKNPFKVKIRPNIPLFLQQKNPIIKSYIPSTIGPGKLNPLQLALFRSQKDIPGVNPNVIETVAALLEKKKLSSSPLSSQSTHSHQKSQQHVSAP